MLLSDLDFKIPEKLIALKPTKPRDNSNLVIVRENLEIIKFKELVKCLNPGDAIIFNDTKVIPGLLNGKINNRKVTVNLNKVIDKKKIIWNVLIKSNRSPKKNDIINFNDKLNAKITNEIFENNFKSFNIKFFCEYEDFKERLYSIGKIPLPPYIIKKRKIHKFDSKDYQTIFAEKEGAVASPTASLHFTKKLINNLKNKGIKLINITLHVNGGTFLPIKSENVFDHKMHCEFGVISKKAANEINKIRKSGGKVFAVGTTVLRLLESSKDSKGHIKSFTGETNIFLKPGTKINSVDALITNFHTPRSTLLLLIFAILGKKKTLELYRFAIKKKLRFFSYGDACLIWIGNGKI